VRVHACPITARAAFGPLVTLLALALALVLLTVPAVVTAQADPTSTGPDVVTADTEVVTAATLVAPAPLDPTFIAAPASASLLLVEADTGQVLLARDVERRRPIASAIKLLTALTVIDALPPGSFIVVGDEVTGVTGSSFGLGPGEVWSVEDLLVGLLLRSGNDVALTLAHAVSGSEAAFVTRMEHRLQGLGIEGAELGSPTGLETEDALSALELAVVARAALDEPRIRDVVGRTSVAIAGNASEAENRNLLIGRFDGATGLKTGYTEAAGYTLAASARRDGRELIAVVLGTEGEEQRLTIAAALLEHGFERTEVVSVGGSVVLRTGLGPVQRQVPARPMTIPSGATVSLLWPVTDRPDAVLGAVEVRVGRAVVGALPVQTVDARSASGASGAPGTQALPSDAGLGAALVDGAYAALRAASLTGTLR